MASEKQKKFFENLKKLYGKEPLPSYEKIAHDFGYKHKNSVWQYFNKLKEENKYRVKGDAFPKQINKFNWGACILTPVWGIFNNTPIACLIILIGLIPYIGWILGIIFSLYCGIKGNEWAWQNKQWQSMEHFHAVQKNWAIAGIVFEIVLMFIVVHTAQTIINKIAGY